MPIKALSREYEYTNVVYEWIRTKIFVFKWIKRNKNFNEYSNSFEYSKNEARFSEKS